jgi:hypothetical protein
MCVIIRFLVLIHHYSLMFPPGFLYSYNFLKVCVIKLVTSVCSHEGVLQDCDGVKDCSDQVLNKPSIVQESCVFTHLSLLKSKTVATRIGLRKFWSATWIIARVLFVWCARSRVVVKQRSMASGGIDHFEPSREEYLPGFWGCSMWWHVRSPQCRKKISVSDWLDI